MPVRTCTPGRISSLALLLMNDDSPLMWINIHGSYRAESMSTEQCQLQTWEKDWVNE